MASINRDILIPYMAAYKAYLDGQIHGENARPMANEQEDYKRGIVAKAVEALKQESWNESEIGTGTIGEHAIKAVQRHLNLIGRFQASTFSDKVKEDPKATEKVLFDLYRNRKDRECFEQLCELFGRKYDLIAYLYFIHDPSSYLPLRSTIFDRIFKKLQINLQTAGRCSWENYQEFLSTIASVRDVMREFYQTADVDLLDAHSFLWTLNLDVLNMRESDEAVREVSEVEKMIEVGAIFSHKEYGRGVITKLTEEKVYIDFNGKPRIFPYPQAFEKGYLL